MIRFISLLILCAVSCQDTKEPAEPRLVSSYFPGLRDDVKADYVIQTVVPLLELKRAKEEFDEMDARSKVAEQVWSCPTLVPEPYRNDARARRGTLIVVFKEQYRLGLYKNGELQKVSEQDICLQIAMGGAPQGPKTMRDYSSTPEGWYRVGQKRDVGATVFYRGLLINYPNKQDVERAFKENVIDTPTARLLFEQIKTGKLPSQVTPMGGSVLIHGMGSSNPFWTAGCVALDNEDIDLLFPLVHTGDDILLIPWKREDHSAVN